MAVFSLKKNQSAHWLKVLKSIQQQKIVPQLRIFS